MRFSDIPGQEEAKGALREMVATGHVPHALMLTGPAGAGKMMLARAFAQYLHCTSPAGGEPCGTCRNCRLHAELSHPDLHFSYPIVKNATKKILVSADRAEEWRTMLTDHPAMPDDQWLALLEAGNSQPSIHVEEAAEIIGAEAYPPYASDYKVFIIWLPERLQVAAANKLLKVIEEPSPGTVFILVSDNELQVLPTIFSRVRRIAAGRLSDRDIEEYLTRRYGLPEHVAMQYAPVCGGSLIRADESGANAGEREEFLALYQEIMRSAYARQVLALRRIAEKIAAFGREKIRRFMAYSASMMRENFIHNMKMPGLNAMTPAEETFSNRFAPYVNHRNIEGLLAETDRARRDIERNANVKVTLFDYFLLIIILLRK